MWSEKRGPADSTPRGLVGSSKTRSESRERDRERRTRQTRSPSPTTGTTAPREQGEQVVPIPETPAEDDGPEVGPLLPADMSSAQKDKYDREA